MSLPRFRYALLLGFIIGVLVPTVVMICARLRILYAGEWLLFVWPSSLMLMATENLGYSVEALGIVALSIAYNALLYIIAFSVIWCVAWLIRSGRASLRDGTTI
jgi:hypothetical protein